MTLPGLYGKKKIIDPNENCLVDIHGLFEV